MGLLAISDTISNFIGRSKIQFVEILSPKSDCPEIHQCSKISLKPILHYKVMQQYLGHGTKMRISKDIQPKTLDSVI